jgi:hypothetical protein
LPIVALLFAMQHRAKADARLPTANRAVRAQDVRRLVASEFADILQGANRSRHGPLARASHEHGRRASEAAIHNYLRGIVERNVDLITHFHDEAKRGKYDEDEAKARATEVLLSQKIGDTGYNVAINGQGILQVHPRIPGKTGTAHYRPEGEPWGVYGVVIVVTQSPDALQAAREAPDHGV